MRAPRSTVHRARSLRRALTLPEVLLWEALRRRQLDGLLFRRQHPLGSYVLDFYCPEYRLAVEVDGMVHDLPERAESDVVRDGWLAGQGIRVLRVPAREVLSVDQRPDVLATIAAAARETSSTALRAVPLLRSAEEDARVRGGGCARRG